jgi:hypothetical protein
MGGFTKIQLKDTSQENIDEQNQRLREYGLRKNLKFYSERDIEKEYEYFLKNDGNYPERMFPRDQINSLEDFKKYWNPRAVGEAFVPPVGALTFDCYFGRTSKRAMHAIACWILSHGDSHPFTTSGSYSTFVERSGYKAKTNQRRLLDFETGL